MQATWNQDGSKHDKKTFNASIGSLNTVQTIARDALGLPGAFKLEEASKAAQVLAQINESANDIKGKPHLFRVVTA
jgi:hypothetical protein